MVHTAFDAVQIIRDSPLKIESVALWGSRLLVGCIDGSLRTYAPEDPQGLDSSAEATAPVYILKETRVGFGKKALTALDVLQSRSLLISLSDAVAIHTLPDFDVVAQLVKTKGALLYAWEEERGLLCVARGKKLNLYQYDGVLLLPLIGFCVPLSIVISTLSRRWVIHLSSLCQIWIHVTHVAST